MKMPWTRRAEEAERQARAAKDELADVERQWIDVRAVTDPAHAQHYRNGWTETAQRLFSGNFGGSTP